MRVGPRVGPRVGLLVGPRDGSAAPATPPVYESAGVAASGTGALSPAAPASVGATDLEILAVVNTHSTTTAATLSSAQGFTAVPGGAIDSGAFGGLHGYITLFYRIGGGAAPTVADNGEFNVARIYRISGVNVSDPFNVLSTTGDNDGDTAMSVAGAVTDAAQCLALIIFGGFLGGAQTVDGQANADLASVTVEDNTSYNVSGDFVYLGLVTGVKAAAGAFGATTGTWSAGAYRVYAGVALALNPA